MPPRLFNRPVTAFSAALVLLTLTVPALSAEWIEYHFEPRDGRHFYYDPGSVSRDGSVVTVAWYDSVGVMPDYTGRHEWAVFTVRIDCLTDYMFTTRVDRYDSVTSRHIATVNLENSATNRPFPISPGSMGAALSATACKAPASPKAAAR